MRRGPNMSEKLAATLLTLGDIPYEDAKQMTAAQINSLYQFDHYPIRHESGGPTEPWNLVPRLIMAHRVKTATKDAPEIAHGRNVRKSAEQHRLNMLAKSILDGVASKRVSAIPSRPFPKVRRQMQSRGWR